MSWDDHVHPHGPLTELVPGLWQVTGSLPPSPVPRNMAIWRTPSGGTCVHSAVAVDPPTLGAIEALGSPEMLIVPCPLHRADAAVWRARFPRLRVVAPIAARAAAEKVVAVDDDAETALPGIGVEALAPAGLKPFELTCRVPLPDGRHALVFADALFHLDHLPGLQGWVFRYVTRSTGHFGITRIGRALLLRDRAAFAAWLRGLGEADGLAAISVGHGRAIVDGCADALRAAADAV